MAAAVNERAAQENVEEYVKVLGIDSRSEDTSHELPDDANSLTLELEESLWSHEREHAPYLGEDHELPPSGGAARQRPVGRSYVDNPEGLEQAWRFLERQIEQFVTELEESLTEATATELNVWVCNSLAGGTGSGTFPLLTGLLDEILVELETERHIETTLRGAGSLLRLDRLAEQIRKPEYPPAYYLNAYTALSDLQVLLSDEPASVRLHPDAEQYVQEELAVGGVFDQYLLVALYGQERKYLNSANRMVADAIYYFGAATAIEDFPDHPGARTARLFSLDAGELVFPVETAEQYVQLSEDIRGTREELDHLEREQEHVTHDLNYLDAIRSLDNDSLPSHGSPVSRTLIRRFEEEATAVERYVTPDELDAHLAESVSEIETDVEIGSGREFDSSLVVRYLFLSRLLAAVEQRCNRVRDDLSELVATVFETHRDQLARDLDEGSVSALESNPAEDVERVEEFLEAELDRLTEQREDTLPFITDFFSDLRTRIEKIEETRRELSTRRTEYQRYQALRNSVQSQFSTSRKRLLDLRRELEETQYELEDRIAAVQRELASRQRHRERLATELREDTREGHRTTIGIEQPEWLDAEVLDRIRANGFKSLVDADLVDRETIQLALKQVCSDRHEPIQDRHGFDSPAGVLAPILAEANAEEWLDDIEAAAMEAGFDTIEAHSSTTDTHSIGLLGLYAGVDLEGTSEFGTLDQYFTDSDRHLSELFGSEVDAVPQPVAYPEL